MRFSPLLLLFLLHFSPLSAQDSLLFVIRVDDITSRTTSTQYMPRGIIPFQNKMESKGAVVSWAVMPARLSEPGVNTGGELGRQLRQTHARGHEIVLHGFDHICDFDNQSSHEMYHPSHARPFTYAEQQATIRKGLKLLADSVNGVRPTSFIPPGHYSDATTHHVLADEGFKVIGIGSPPGDVLPGFHNIGTSEDFNWALTQGSYVAKRTETLQDIRSKAASQGHYTFLLHDPFTRPGYLNGLVIDWAGEILDSVKAEYGSRLRFVTISELGEALTQEPTSIETEKELATTIQLLGNYPNPFNPSTVIRYRKSEIGRIRLTVHDILGREIAVLTDGVMPAGTHSVTFDAGMRASGVYLVRLTSGSEVLTQTMMLVR